MQLFDWLLGLAPYLHAGVLLHGRVLVFGPSLFQQLPLLLQGEQLKFQLHLRVHQPVQLVLVVLVLRKGDTCRVQRARESIKKPGPGKLASVNLFKENDDTWRSETCLNDVSALILHFK